MLLVESAEDVARLQVSDPARLAYVTQTTLSVDETQEIVAALKERFPLVKEPKKQDICYATQNRQDAVKFMAPQVEVVIVVGSPNSSTPTACANWPRVSACQPTWWTRLTRCSPNGWRASAASA